MAANKKKKNNTQTKTEKPSAFRAAADSLAGLLLTGLGVGSAIVVARSVNDGYDVAKDYAKKNLG